MYQLVPLQPEHFATLSSLAASIWHQHYLRIISAEQIAYMLKDRYTAKRLMPYINSEQQWCWLLFNNDRAIGYTSCALQPDKTQMKLEQLYLLAEFQGQGLGKRMLELVLSTAHNQGCQRLWLTVNKQNVTSIAFYQRMGMSIFDATRLDIGNNFFMDDYLMEIALPLSN